MNLYTFPILEKKLDTWGYPQVDTSVFKVIKGVDFGQAIQNEKIDFRHDGIYYNINDNWYRGYVFIKEPYIEKYGNYPKFHLQKCSTLQGYLDNGNFNVRYDWSNSSFNDLIDKTEKTKFNDEDLNYCGNCKNIFDDNFSLTSEFHDSLDQTEIQQEEKELNVLGEILGIELIHKNYLKESEYVCSKCEKMPMSQMHNRWWYVMHVDNNIHNISQRNLLPICISCYYKLHPERFISDAKKSQLKAFGIQYLNS